MNSLFGSIVMGTNCNFKSQTRHGLHSRCGWFYSIRINDAIRASMSVTQKRS